MEQIGKEAQQKQFFHPMEVKLTRSGLTTDNNGSIDALTQENLNQENVDLGKYKLINAVLGLKEKDAEDKSKYKMEALMCVTCFNEPLSRVDSTIKGILKNLSYFGEIGIASLQLGIVVIFDLDAIYNSKDLNNHPNNILPYFDQLDLKYEVPEDQRLRYKYQQLLDLQQIERKYGKINFVDLKYDQEKIKQLYNEDRMRLLEVQQEYFKEKNREEITDNVVEWMKKYYKNAKDKLINYYQSAYIYQELRKYTKRDNTYEIPIFYTFKLKRGKKLAEHQWFFKGFCQEMKPKYCFLIDCGAIPAQQSIYNLYQSMESDKQVGGVCGYMRILEEKSEDNYSNESIDILSKFLNEYIFDIQKCQTVEYHCGHILDKSFESLLGFIHVLPGAFSGYRYSAFTEDSKENSSTNILDHYLEQVTNPDFQYESIEEANMFLAEDRILCMHIFKTKNKNFILRYIPDAVVDVDPILTLIQLNMQRRRWINGSWFALNYVQKNFNENLGLSTHTWWEKLLFYFSIIQAEFLQFMQYLIISFQIIWIFTILKSVIIIEDEDLQFASIAIIIFAYCLLIFVLIFLSLSYQNTKDKQIKQYYESKFYGISTILGLTMIATTVYTVYLFIELILTNGVFTIGSKENLNFEDFYPIFVFASLVFTALPFLFKLNEIVSIILGLPSYFFFQPSYLNFFLIYAFCRIDDLTWGTKGQDTQQSEDEQILKKYSQFYKFQFVSKWILWNMIATIIALIILSLGYNEIVKGTIFVLGLLITLLCFFKGVGSCFYNIYWFYLSYKRSSLESQKKNKLQKSKKKILIDEDLTFMEKLFEKYENWNEVEN